MMFHPLQTPAPLLAAADDRVAGLLRRVLVDHHDGTARVLAENETAVLAALVASGPAPWLLDRRGVRLLAEALWPDDVIPWIVDAVLGDLADAGAVRVDDVDGTTVVRPIGVVARVLA